MIKSIIAFFIFICQLLQSIFLPGAVTPNEGIDFDDINSAVITDECNTSCS